MCRFAFFAIVACTLGLTLGYPTGAPEEVCDSMMPGHGHQPQVAHTFPYKVVTSKNIVKPNEKVKLQIEGQQPFKGFLIEIRNEQGKAVGKFETDENTKTLNCHDGIAVCCFFVFDIFIFNILFIFRLVLHTSALKTKIMSPLIGLLHLNLAN